jgi:hypothetical protein
MVVAAVAVLGIFQVRVKVVAAVREEPMERKVVLVVFTVAASVVTTRLAAEAVAQQLGLII